MIPSDTLTHAACPPPVRPETVAIAAAVFLLGLALVLLGARLL